MHIKGYCIIFCRYWLLIQPRHQLFPCVLTLSLLSLPTSAPTYYSYASIHYHLTHNASHIGNTTMLSCFTTTPSDKDYQYIKSLKSHQCTVSTYLIHQATDCTILDTLKFFTTKSLRKKNLFM